jgi:hypothetical protein
MRQDAIRRTFPAAALGLAAMTVAACGGGGSPAGPDPAATPTPAAAATPRPSPTPTPDPRIGLADGPIIRFTLKFRIAAPDVREPVQDPQGRWILYPGERVDVDGTQKNASNEICRWNEVPQWRVDGIDLHEGQSTGVVLRRGSSQPFLYKLTTERPGEFAVQGTVDGITSNVLRAVVVRR